MYKLYKIVNFVQFAIRYFVVDLAHSRQIARLQRPTAKTLDPRLRMSGMTEKDKYKGNGNACPLTLPPIKDVGGFA